MLVEGNDEACQRERGRIVPAVRCCRVSMANSSLAILLPQPAADEPVMVGPGKSRLRTGVSRIECHRTFQQRDRPSRVLMLPRVNVWHRLQDEIIRIQTIGPFAFDTPDLHPSQAWLDGAD